MEPIFDVLVLVRWLHFGAMFVLFGGALFWAYVPDDAGVTSSRSFTLRCLRTAAPVALVTGAGWLAATIANMTGGIDGLGDLDTLHAFFLETIFGPIEAARMALLAGIAVLVYVPMRDRFRLVATAAASGLLLVSQAWLGHAAEGGDTLLGATMIVAYAVHVLAAAAWLGGLPPLLARMATLRTRAPPAAILRLLSRYSGMATIAVCSILATGVANAAFRVAGHLDALLPTRYGVVLMVKVALVALMLGFSAYNRFLAMPRLRPPAQGGGLEIDRVATSIGCEIVLGGLVLAAAAVLGITPPPAA